MKASNQGKGLLGNTCLVRRRSMAVAVAAALAASVITGPAFAQASAGESAVLEEVIVTATRRSKRLLDVAQSIGVLTDQYLKDSAFDNLAEFAGQVPGLNFTERGPGRTAITVRGISADPGTGSVSTVGIYIDDIAMTNDDQNAQADIRTFDLERIEVLRGPQGTLYGEGAMGGVIRYITKKPNLSSMEGAMEVSAGIIDGGDEVYGVNGAISIPLIDDKMAVRLVGVYRDIGGYIDNPVLGADNFNSSEILSARANLLWDVSDTLSLEAMAMISRIEVDGDNITRGGAEDEFIAPALNPRDDDYDLYSFTVRYSAPWFDLASVSGFSKRTSSATTVDSDIAIQGFVQPISAFFSDVVPTESLFVLDEENENFTQELRLVSNGESNFQWTAGVWYRNGDFENVANRTTKAKLTYGGNGDLSPFGVPFSLGPNPLGGPVGGAISGEFQSDPSTTNFENISVFGEVSYAFGEHFELLLGGRWSEETRGVKSPLGTGGLNESIVLINSLVGLPNEVTDEEFSNEFFTPKATLSYQPTDDQMYYMTYAEGVRSGGRNSESVIVRGNRCGKNYDEDTTTNYELGMKMSGMEGRLQLDASLFYIDWEDLQVLFFDADTFDSCIDNAGTAHSMGGEVAVTALLTDNLTLSVSGTMIEAELDEAIPGADSGDALIGKGTRLPNVPEYKVAASVHYERPISDDWIGQFNYNINSVGDSTAALEPGVRGDLEQPSYIISNLRVGVVKNDLAIHLFVDNLTDEYAVYADDTFGGIHRNQPRTAGVSLRYDF